MIHPDHKQGDAGDGRSPDSRVIAIYPAFPVSQWRSSDRGSPLTVAGAVTDLVPVGYAAPCSLLTPLLLGEPLPYRNGTRPQHPVKIYPQLVPAEIAWLRCVLDDQRGVQLNPYECIVFFVLVMDTPYDPGTNAISYAILTKRRLKMERHGGVMLS